MVFAPFGEGGRFARPLCGLGMRANSPHPYPSPQGEGKIHSPALRVRNEGRDFVLGDSLGLRPRNDAFDEDNPHHPLRGSRPLQRGQLCGLRIRGYTRPLRGLGMTVWDERAISNFSEKIFGKPLDKFSFYAIM